jgi:dihydroneopterin aldolase
VHKRDQISMAGMRCHALVGVLARERELPPPSEVDLVRAVRGDA